MAQFFYTYVLSCTDGRLYVGSTEGLDHRMEEHHAGKCRTTSMRRPVELVYYETCRSEAGARDRERQLKTGFGRNYLKRRLQFDLAQ